MAPDRPVDMRSSNVPPDGSPEMAACGACLPLFEDQSGVKLLPASS